MAGHHWSRGQARTSRARACARGTWQEAIGRLDIHMWKETIGTLQHVARNHWPAQTRGRIPLVVVTRGKKPLASTGMWQETIGCDDMWQKAIGDDDTGHERSEECLSLSMG